MVSVGESGSVLAQARTRPFDVTPRRTYVAPSKPRRRRPAPAFALLMAGIPTVQTRLTEYFLEQGARMYAFASRPSRLRSDGSF